MATTDDKLKALDEHNVKAAAIFSAFSVDEMEKVLETNIFDLMGVQDSLSQEQKDDLLRVFQDTIQNRVSARILDSLSDDDAAAFGKLIEEDMEKAEQFLVDKGINKDQIAVVEIVLYKLELAKGKKEVE